MWLLNSASALRENASEPEIETLICKQTYYWTIQRLLKRSATCCVSYSQVSVITGG
jgi:hypothetical protein